MFHRKETMPWLDEVEKYEPKANIGFPALLGVPLAKTLNIHHLWLETCYM
jgi:hypothetical protein